MTNSELDWLEKLQNQAKELNQKKTETINNIRSGFTEKVIVFMDVVGSTQFKIEHAAEPEIWILRVKQFSEILASAIKSCNGTVVKYIGDEVMGSFDNVNDSINLINRIKEIEDALFQATGFETRIKTAIDICHVYTLQFDEHLALDPQGTPVDRCARISKYVEPGTVLTSEEYKNKTTNLKWTELGSVELKGLGETKIFQLGDSTVTLVEKITILKNEYEQLFSNCNSLKEENNTLKENNTLLSNQLKQVGATPTIIPTGETELKDKIDSIISEIQCLIDDANVSSFYPRFIFLHLIGQSEEYNKFKGKEFDDLIEAKLVYDTTGDYKWFELNTSHKRNTKILDKIQNLQTAIDDYIEEYGQPAEDLFDWNINDPDYWKKYIGYNVS